MHLLLSSKELVRKMKRTVRSPANYRKLANLSLMFAALSSAEFQGNGFSAAEHRRVSVEKTFHFGTKLF